MTRLVRALAQPPPPLGLWLAALMLAVPERAVAGDATPPTLSATEARALSQSLVPVILPRDVPPDLAIVKVWVSPDRRSYYVLYSGVASTLFAAGAMGPAQRSAAKSRRDAPSDAALSRAFAEAHVVAAGTCTLRAPRSIEIGRARYSYVACGAGAVQALGKRLAPPRRSLRSKPRPPS
jgi:hypothetical protein